MTKPISRKTPAIARTGASTGERLNAEELRDSVMAVSGDLDDALGGPSEELTPANKRRTVYGKVSRDRLDTYLQTFDFPSPNISAEKRFTTTVPLQRLFLMNSDFMQIEAEQLAKRVAEEPDNAARIKKAYQLAYGRDPSEEEIKLGLDYLHAEPMKEYEENKNKPPENGRGGGRGGRGGPAAASEQKREGDKGGSGTRSDCASRDANGHGNDGWRAGHGSRRTGRRCSRNQIRADGVGPLRQDPAQLDGIFVYQLRTKCTNPPTRPLAARLSAASAMDSA